MFPYPILPVFALPHSSYTVGTPLKFYIKIYNMKLSLIFRPNDETCPSSGTWRGGGGGGNSHIKGTRMLCVSLGGKIDRFWSPFRLLKTESHYF